MAQEAVLVVETELPIPFTVAEGTGIKKGSILQLADQATVSIQSDNNQVVGGIIGREKIAGDGFVKADVYRGGIWRGTASGSITFGDSLGTTAFKNEIISNSETLNLSGSKSLGIALETTTDGETFLFELRPTVVHTGA